MKWSCKRAVVAAVKRLALAGARVVFICILKARIAQKKRRHWLILDIDNTLADTWPSFHLQWMSESERLRSLPPIKQTCGAVRLIIEAKRNEIGVLFLTSRNISHINESFKWLQTNGLSSSPLELILVPSPQEKIVFLRILERRCNANLTYIDDLSWNHERGQIRFYDEMITEIRSMNLNYVGFEDINRCIASKSIETAIVALKLDKVLKT